VLLQRGIFLEETAGDIDGAIELYRQILSAGPWRHAWTIRRAILPPGDPAIAQSLQGFAQLEYELHRPAQAEAHYREAIANAEQSIGPTSTTLALALHNLATLLAETRRLDEARVT
jgi:tetratricopeptide (TPR) repeat protein